MLPFLDWLACCRSTQFLSPQYYILHYTRNGTATEIISHRFLVFYISILNLCKDRSLLIQFLPTYCNLANNHHYKLML
nr:MAG TPA: hypothetical protein [Caudoviricetes sp.]